jgi:hypothetical protein
MLESWGFSIFVFAVIIFLGGFAVGTQWNISKGNKALKWFRDGLPLIGEKATMRWLGSSVVELKMQKAKDPFRNAEALVVFEPRDVVLLWAFTHAHGRRDTLIFRAQLSTSPQFEMEAFAPNAWHTHGIERDVTRKNWTQLELPSEALQAYYSGDAALKTAKPLIDLAQRGGGKIIRLSIHRTVPNLEIHWMLPDIKNNTSRSWFANVRRIGEEAIKA